MDALADEVQSNALGNRNTAISHEEMNTVSPSEQETTRFLKTTVLFSHLDQETLKFFSPKLEEIVLYPDDNVMEQGDLGDSLYLIKEGKVGILAKNDQGEEVIVAEREPGESIGEIALLTGDETNANVCALDQARLLRLSRSALEDLAGEHPCALEPITQAIIQRIRQAQLHHMLRTNKLLEGLSDSARDHLENRLSVRMLHSGDYLVRQGEESDSMHIVISGRLQVATQQPDGTVQVWADVGRGQTVGETGILTGNKRSASVYALRDTLVGELSKDSFHWLISKYPEVMTKHLIGDYVTRLLKQIQGTSRDRNTLATFTVLPLGQDVPMDEFCASLSEALTEFGPTLHLNSGRLDQLLDKKGIAQTGKDQASNIALVGWLSEQETQFRYVVYQADATPTQWTDRCLRQADRILRVCRAQSEPSASEVVSLLQQQRKTIAQSLVLLHEQAVQNPQNTRRWLDATAVASHNHVRRHDQRGYSRLARMLTGHGVGLVLSGGGARALAHIGAIRALEEAGLDFDMVGGTSMGAVMAAQCAMGWNSELMLENTKRVVSRHNKLQYTLPIISVLTGASWKQFLVELFGDTRIEDLWLNYFCCSTNLTDSHLSIHESGMLWEAVRASSSIPGLIPPVFDTGKMLVDGAVLNNMPVDVMRERNNGGKIYAIDVGGGIKTANVAELAPVLSGWRLFFRRNKKGNVIPSITNILMQSATMGSQLTQKATERMADLYINADVSDHSLLDFNVVEPLVDKGYRCAREQIVQWQDKKMPAQRFEQWRNQHR